MLVAMIQGEEPGDGSRWPLVDPGAQACAGKQIVTAPGGGIVRAARPTEKPADATLAHRDGRRVVAWNSTEVSAALSTASGTPAGGAMGQGFARCHGVA